MQRLRGTQMPNMLINLAHLSSKAFTALPEGSAADHLPLGCDKTRKKFLQAALKRL